MLSLRSNVNKVELFQFLSENFKQRLLATKFGQVFSNRPADITALSPCKHETGDMWARLIQDNEPTSENPWSDQTAINNGCVDEHMLYSTSII